MSPRTNTRSSPLSRKPVSVEPIAANYDGAPLTKTAPSFAIVTTIASVSLMTIDLAVGSFTWMPVCKNGAVEHEDDEQHHHDVDQRRHVDVGHTMDSAGVSWLRR